MRQFCLLNVAIQPEVRFIAKQNSLMKIGINGNLVLGPFDESTPCLMIVLMNCQTKLRINHLTAVKSVAILEMPSRHGATFNSRRAASPFVRLVEGEEMWEVPDHIQGILLLNWGETELNHSVTYMVLKATANDRRHLTLSHDVFRGP
ncbi:uncharacterized protein TNCV_4261121 [Trichonephila clavipes]|nr:uncharacterized protein TNCV_4261121 [Trichonephila clavipes]